ncbi:MAG: YaeP family protein [Saccharospirillaceae bacterium]|nr:YaeP family protein [Saccharospirillaceae bacterium]
MDGSSGAEPLPDDIRDKAAFAAANLLISDAED